VSAIGIPVRVGDEVALSNRLSVSKSQKVTNAAGQQLIVFQRAKSQRIELNAFQLCSAEDDSVSMA
jgi:hypothetical protein